MIHHLTTNAAGIPQDEIPGWVAAVAIVVTCVYLAIKLNRKEN